MPKKPIELPPEVAKAFVKHMHAYYAEPTALTRRRDRDLPQECWRIYYGNVHAGTIAQCVGNPGAAPMAMALRVLSGLEAGRVHQRHGGDIPGRS